MIKLRCFFFLNLSHSFDMLEMRVLTICIYVLHFLSQGYTALINASNFGHIEVVELLLALPGIDYNHADNQV
jgi:ankyrin repeat protein